MDLVAKIKGAREWVQDAREFNQQKDPQNHHLRGVVVKLLADCGEFHEG